MSEGAPEARALVASGDGALVAYSDGAARGNPGPASYGVVILDRAGRELRTLSEAIGVTTNNVAEYRGAIAAVEEALALGATDLALYMDAELVVRQIAGAYRVRSDKLKPLHARLTALIERLPRFQVAHVPRARNARADALANAALDGPGS